MKKQPSLKGRKLPAAWPMLAALLLIALVWIAGVGKAPWVFEELHQNYLTFRLGAKSFYADSDGHGVLSSGPNFSLPAGTYKLRWRIETDENNAFRITTGNNARVEPSEIAIEANSWDMEAEFEILDHAEDVQIQVVFENGQQLRIHNIELCTPEYTDGTWTITWLLLAFILIYWLHMKGWWTAERKTRLVLLGAVVFFASIPALRTNLNDGHDTVFHKMRILNIVEGLSAGNIPVRVGGTAYNGYGGAMSVFYPDLFLYFPAALMLSGASIQYAVSALIIGINLLSAATMYLCAKHIFESKTAGTFASMLYTLATYRLTNVYTRAAFGEAIAMAVVPLFLWGLWEVIFGDAKRWKILVLGATAVFQSHMLTTVICAVIAVCMGVCALVKIVREKRLAPILKAIAVTALLNLFWLVPFAMYSAQGLDVNCLASWCSYNAIEPVRLFEMGSSFPLEVGLSLLFGAAVMMYAAVLKEKQDRHSITGWICIGVGAVLMYMTTTAFPWEEVEAATDHLTDFLQFPWRLLLVIDVLFALAGGYGFACVAKRENQRHLVMLGAAALCMLSVSGQIMNYTSVDDNPYIYWKTSMEDVVLYREYMLPGTDMEKIRDVSVSTEGNVTFGDYAKHGTRITAQVEAGNDASISFPLFGFDGYAAEVNGERMETALGDNNRLTVLLPAGTKGELFVWFEGKAIWRVFDGISLATALALVFVTIRQRCGKRREAAKC